MAGSSSTDLVGRDPQIGQIGRVLEDAKESLQIVLISGEPGIGKSSLLVEAVRLGSDAGFTVVSSRCPEQEGAPPFWPWTTAMRELLVQFPEAKDEFSPGTLGFLGNLLPELKTSSQLSDVGNSQFDQMMSVVELFKAVSTERPLLVVVDDLHWADVSSLKLLEYVVANGRQLPMAIVVAMRDSEFDIGNELSSTLGTLSRGANSTRIALGRLDVAESTRLLSDILESGIPRELAETLYSYAEGNPFYTRELALLQEQSEGARGTKNFAVPAGVRDVVSQRLRLLNDDCLKVLRQASIFGREFDVRLVAGASGDNVLDTLEFLELPERMSLVSPVDSLHGYRFTHALIREVLLASLSLSERVRGHAKAAKAIEDSRDHPDENHASELAHHYSSAETLTGTKPVVKYRVMAGHHAVQRFAWAEAEVHFREAEKIYGSEHNDATRAEILEWLGVVAASNGDIGEGYNLVWEAFEMYDALGMVDEAVRTAIHPVPSQRPKRVNNSKRALELAKPNSKERAQLLSRDSNEIADVDPREHWGEMEAQFDEAIKIADHHDDEDLKFWILGRYILACTNSLELDKATELCQIARPFATPDRDLEALTHYYHWSGMVNLYQGDLGTAATDAELSEKYARASGRNFRLFQSATTSYAVMWVMGEFAKIIERGPIVGQGMYVSSLRGLRAHALLALGRTDEVEEAEYQLFGPDNEDPLIDLFHAPIRGEWDVKLMMLTGKKPDKWFVDDTNISALPPVGKVNAHVTWGLHAIEIEDRETIRAELDASVSFGDKYRGSFWGPHYPTSTVHALYAASLGLVDKARKYFEDSIHWCREGGYVVDQVVALAESAEFAAANNVQVDGKSAAELAAEGQRVADSVGMVTRNATFEKFINGSPAASDYPDGLTEREVEVLAELATGKSNREIAEALFITQNTVIRHVANIFAKTGSANRAQAAVYASEHGIRTDAK